jgi:chemotaxis methyl-accepting protein methylase
MHTATELPLGTTTGSDEECDHPFVERVLDILRARTERDFSVYRRPMLERRIANRMLAAGSPTRSHYMKLLSSSEAEPQRLLERITIKVSRFYRHRLAFDCLRAVVLPGLAVVRGGAPLRVWCVGCGAGEEAYSLAMLLEEAGIAGSVHACDIDTSALKVARLAHYPISATAELPSELLERFLEPVVLEGRPCYRVSDDVKTRVQFSLHDITAVAAPPAAGPFDLVSCRNVLIYLGRTAQLAATERLLDSVAPGGALCLGEAEWPCTELVGRLEPQPHRTRVFRLRAGAPR